MPSEHALTDEEHEEIQAAALSALSKLKLPGDDPGSVVQALEDRVEKRRVRKERDEQIFALGALFAHCLADALGWEMLHLRWEGLDALAVCTMDRSVVVLPLLAVSGLFDDPSLESPLLSTFERLAAGERPSGLARGDYAVLLP